ncbi:unnamed protein product [Allacma fusca]|uniref:Exocyst complex component Sec6 n=1 Tax=Allacma fusca TaxID=39272 RepID=A0A8J2NWZ6_9HEXA|nr:unnamed protein product [Allacma fusca]
MQLEGFVLTDNELPRIYCNYGNMSRISKLESSAKSKAVERICNLLQRPDQLEKVEEFKKRESRKKASKEAMLKTALQSQLDGVRSGLELLKFAREDLTDVGNHTAELQKCLKDLLALGSILEDVREENFRHSQYAMAMENMNNIFNISKNLDKAETLINDGKMLQAHILLSELESSRDELLYELFRMGNKSEHTMLLDYFSDVEKLSENLEKHLSLNLKRTLNIAVKQPTLLVTTLRIIEREERADAAAIQRFDMSGFKSPGRPKCWKAKALKILEDSVKEKLEASQLESRAENKMWLVRYLEVMRQLILQDLLVVKALCVPCFPSSYNILNCYVKMYHRCLSKQLQECIGNGLEGFEYVSLLAWVLNTYTGPQLLLSIDLGLEPQDIPTDLLDKQVNDMLMRDYLKNIGENYRSCLRIIIAKEVEEWWKNCSPQSDSDGHFRTEAPVDIFKMVDENLQLAKTVSPELVHKMLLLSLEIIREYGQTYQDEVKYFKVKYFDDRSKVQYFTHFMIAIINNCSICTDLAHQTKDRYWKSAVGDSKAVGQFDAVLQTFEDSRNKAARFLLDEAFLDLEPHFQELVTRNWVKSTVAVDTICTTLEDYFQDYMRLKPKNFDDVMKQGKELVAKKYLLALMSRKIVLKSQEERKETATKITNEARQIQTLFERVGSSVGIKTDCPFDAVKAIAEVINVEDLDMLSLELHSFIKHYPDLTKEQLMAILSVRGDIGRFDLKAKATEIMPGNTAVRKGPIPNSIFSQVDIPPSLFS